ncbi:MAG: phosphoribosylamine--glycine ligase [Gemmatimonadaceae bacterium]|nr:phosphoribosylamine--glycine ligase [Acetobacteraceae bacterium]
MRVLGIGSRIDLGDLYLALVREGHDVRVHAADPSYAGCFAGLLDRVPDWRAELPWVGRDGLVLFEKVGRGAEQDALREDGYHVIGGSRLGDRLEYDRAFGQGVLRDAGLDVAPSQAFDSPDAAAAWLVRNPGRMVLKHDNNARATFVGDHRDGVDVLFRLRRTPPGRVLLMPRLDGVEVGVGAYFDGDKFLRPACIDFEHKRFFPGEIGEMTGEMGTLLSYEGADLLFDATLGRLAPHFAAAGHVGYVNLNMIANAGGLWPLEFTCRFGNPGYAILAPLQRDGWGDLLGRMMRRDSVRFTTAPGWSVGIVLTVPPFPDELPGADPDADPPIFFHDPPTGAEQAHYHYADMRAEGAQLFARRRTGYAMVVTGTGPTVPRAQAAARTRARNVIIPNLRWRNDIGDQYLAHDAAQLADLGWLGRAAA